MNGFKNLASEPAALGRLCVETRNAANPNQVSNTSRPRAAVC